jgi:hypothetical protein
MNRLVPLWGVVVCLGLLAAGCAVQSSEPSSTPLPLASTAVSVLPTDTSTGPTSPSDAATSEPTPAPLPTHTGEASADDYGSMIVMLMRAVNARERVVGIQQSTWGLEGIPDGGRDFPPLDALEDNHDLTPYVQALQFAVPNLVGRSDAPDCRSMFWNDDTETLYSSFAELNLHDGWRSSPEEGNLEEIRQVLERMRTIVVFGNGVTMLSRFASPNTVPGADRDIELLQNAVHDSLPNTDMICSRCPPANYASHYVSNEYPAVQLTRAFLSFDTSRLADGPAIVVHSVRLRVKRVIVLSQTNWDGSSEPDRIGTLGVGVNSGWWDPDTETGTGWGLGPAVWNSSADEAINGWNSCPMMEDHLAAETVGRQDGIDTFSIDSEHINVQGWTQYRIALQDETDRAIPALGDVNWRLYGLSGHPRDHFLILSMAFQSLPPMPSAFE